LIYKHKLMCGIVSTLLQVFPEKWVPGEGYVKQAVKNTTPLECGRMLELFPEELQSLAIENGLQAYRGRQVFGWLHKKRVYDLDVMTNLPRDFRNTLKKALPLMPVRRMEAFSSGDGTKKIHLSLVPGETIETVIMQGDDSAVSVCISTQVGCPVGCIFCRSGSRGLKRNLSASEIIAQVYAAMDETGPDRLSGIVFMGSGDPLLNLDASVRALKILTHPDGNGISCRKITLSTVGIPSGMKRLANLLDGPVSLAVSLHAPDDETRRRLVPGVKAGVREIVESIRKFPVPAGRRITVEYVLIKGINDRPDQAQRLADLLKGLKVKVKVNLLPLNPHDATDLSPPSTQRVHAFQKILTDRGMLVFIRKRRGHDQLAACGQLLSW